MSNKLSWVVAALALTPSAAGVSAQDNGIKVISTPSAPNAIGPYSQAIRTGTTLFISGEIAINPRTNQVMTNATIDDQTQQVLDNIRAILAADGLTMDRVASTTVFLTDINEFDRMNKVYATYFKSCASSPCYRSGGSFAA